MAWKFNSTINQSIIDCYFIPPEFTLLDFEVVRLKLLDFKVKEFAVTILRFNLKGCFVITLY